MVHKCKMCVARRDFSFPINIVAKFSTSAVVVVVVRFQHGNSKNFDFTTLLASLTLFYDDADTTSKYCGPTSVSQKTCTGLEAATGSAELPPSTPAEYLATRQVITFGSISKKPINVNENTKDKRQSLVFGKHNMCEPMSHYDCDCDCDCECVCVSVCIEHKLIILLRY